jgi:septal ring factor EnvC (AmiA/AmiB activator)
MTRKIGIAVVVVVACVAGLSAQSARPAEPGPAPGIDQLLTEVRALRSELNQAASVSIRTQLLVARLQLQEERIDSIARQLTETRQQLAGADQARAAMADPLKALAAVDQAPAVSDDDRDEKNALGPLKAMLAAQQQRAEELRVQEAALSSLLAEEQSRWVELNNRLEEIERTLPPRNPR